MGYMRGLYLYLYVLFRKVALYVGIVSIVATILLVPILDQDPICSFSDGDTVTIPEQHTVVVFTVWGEYSHLGGYDAGTVTFTSLATSTTYNFTYLLEKEASSNPSTQGHSYYKAIPAGQYNVSISETNNTVVNTYYLNGGGIIPEMLVVPAYITGIVFGSFWMILGIISIINHRRVKNWEREN